MESLRPSSGTCVSTTSWSFPKYILLESPRYRSAHSADVEPKAWEFAAEGNNAPPDVILELNVAAPASEPSSVNIVMSELLSVPLKIISVSLPCASIVILPAEVAKVTAASPVVISSAADAPLKPLTKLAFVIFLNAVAEVS